MIFFREKIVNVHCIVNAMTGTQCTLYKTSLRWRHEGRDSVPNHQPYDCFLNRLFKRRWKKISKLRVTDFCAGKSPGTAEFPAQLASNAENVSIWWRHHGNSYPNADWMQVLIRVGIKVIPRKENDSLRYKCAHQEPVALCTLCYNDILWNLKPLRFRIKSNRIRG